MGKVKLVIVEDEFVIAEDIKYWLEDYGYEVASIFDQAEEAEKFILKSPPDLLLADIRLSGKMTGIELIERVKPAGQFPVIYITANSDAETYNKAKMTKPNAFLIKPFTPVNLLASVDLALYNFSNEKIPDRIESANNINEDFQTVIHKSLFIRNNGKYKKIAPNDILFIEAAGSYVHIHTIGERFTLTQNLGSFIKKNPIRNILRIHRSYLVNINRVDSFEESSLFVQGHKLPVSESYKEEFMSRIHCL